MENKDVVIMIPAYNPDDKFILFLNDLRDNGYSRIIVINDGSREDTGHFFETASADYGCDVIMHYVNMGQGRAYKTGLNFYVGKYAKDCVGVIQCDCDGQHHIEDINRCAHLLRGYPDKFILGVRSFKDKGIPFRSRFGNNCTGFVFKACCGLDISDTQTGLKGIPNSFIPRLINTPGERFEYASSVLLETKKAGVDILQFPIKTIYIDNNATSHFNPLIDSIRIYSLLSKYILSSLSAFIVDIIAYAILISALKSTIPLAYIIASTYIARAISSLYTYYVNKRIASKNCGNRFIAFFRFVLFCVVQATCSGLVTNCIVRCLNWNEVITKIIVDTVLFFVSYQLQNRWVFANKGELCAEYSDGSGLKKAK